MPVGQPVSQSVVQPAQRLVDIHRLWAKQPCVGIPDRCRGQFRGDLLGVAAEDSHDSIVALVDRVTNRAVASATLPILRAAGTRMIDAGLAATGSRLDVATALVAAGIARPATLVGFTEESSIAAANQLGYPAVMLGLQPGSSTTVLHDADTADAVIEHRVVLGTGNDAVVLFQAGVPLGESRTIVHVIGGRAVAFEGALPVARGIALAEAAASALQAALVGVELANTDEGLIVWDIHPVADFRKAQLLGDRTIGEAIVAEVMLRAGIEPVMAEEVPLGYALSA